MNNNTKIGWETKLALSQAFGGIDMDGELIHYLMNTDTDEIILKIDSDLNKVHRLSERAKKNVNKILNNFGNDFNPERINSLVTSIRETDDETTIKVKLIIRMIDKIDENTEKDKLTKELLESLLNNNIPINVSIYFIQNKLKFFGMSSKEVLDILYKTHHPYFFNNRYQRLSMLIMNDGFAEDDEYQEFILRNIDARQNLIVEYNQLKNVNPSIFWKVFNSRLSDPKNIVFFDTFIEEPHIRDYYEKNNVLSEIKCDAVMIGLFTLNSLTDKNFTLPIRKKIVDDFIKKQKENFEKFISMSIETKSEEQEAMTMIPRMADIMVSLYEENSFSDETKKCFLKLIDDAIQSKNFKDIVPNHLLFGLKEGKR